MKEKWKELGQALQAERERQNLTLDELQERTHIRKRYLRAIEAGDLSVLPGMVYARGFIKNYAEELGLNGQELLLKYGLLDEQPVAATSTVAGAPPFRETSSLPSRKTKEKTAVLQMGNRLWPQVIMGAAIIGLLGVGYWFLTRLQAAPESVSPRPQAEQPNPPAQQPGQQAGQEPQTPDQPQAEQRTSGPLVPETKNQIRSVYKVTGDKIQLQIKTVNGKCWLDVTTDGQKQYSQVAGEGVTLTFEAKETIRVVAGYSPALEMTVNDQPVEFERVNGRYEYWFEKQ